MPDNLRPEDRRRTMQAVKGRRTGLERRFFSMLAGMRLSGWRTNADNVIGKPDVVFDATRVAFFVDGCFWHGCPHCQRKLPDTNRAYWQRKISRNIERASLNVQRLLSDGWIVVRIWEHEMTTPEARNQVRARIRRALEKSET